MRGAVNTGTQGQEIEEKSTQDNATWKRKIAGGTQESRESVCNQTAHLIVPCQRHADTKTKPKRGSHLCPGMLCSLAWAIPGAYHYYMQLQGCRLWLFLLVWIHKLSQLTQGLNVKGRHISKCRKPYISNQPHYLHISLLLSFLISTSYKILGPSFQFFPPELSSSNPWFIVLAYQTSETPRP